MASIGRVVAALRQVLARPTGPEPEPAVTGADPLAVLSKLPVRSRTNSKTRGTWIDDRGHEHEQVVSGRDDLAARAVQELWRLGLSPEGRIPMASDHVEVKLAVHLRGTGQRHVTLVLNNAPCRPGEFSCDRLLPRICGRARPLRSTGRRGEDLPGRAVIVSHQLEVAYHNDRPVAVSRGREDIARFVDELLTLGWEHTAATVYAVDPDDRPEFPDHEMAIGTGHDFPADAEVPLDTVREAMWELLTTGGRRPGCVTWQEDRGWTATPGTARHAHRARTRPTPDPG